MNEMYRAALDLLRTVEHYDTDGSPAEREMATHIIRDHALPSLVSELHKAVAAI
jgi:hypothetical protein